MPGPTKKLVTDAEGLPAPQYFNPTTDQYEYELGQSGGRRAILYDANGNPLLTTTNPGVVQGPAAHDAVASGNPLRVGGVYRATAPAVQDGDVADILVDDAGRPVVHIDRISGIQPRMINHSGSEWYTLPDYRLLGVVPHVLRTYLGNEAYALLEPNSIGDGVVAFPGISVQLMAWAGGPGWFRQRDSFTSAGDNLTYGLPGVVSWLFDGTKFERPRTTHRFSLLALAQRTGTTDSAWVTSYNVRGMLVHLLVSDVTVAGSGIRVQVLTDHPVTGTSYAMIHDNFASVTTTGHFIYAFHPSSITVGGAVVASVNTVLPRMFFIRVEHLGGADMTYALGLNMIAY